MLAPMEPVRASLVLAPKEPAAAPLVVHLLPPLWGSPSPSPFAIKLLTWLRMAGIPHEARALTRRPRSSTGKIPYVELPDGRVLHDSGLIIATLGRERGVDLDRDLDPARKAVGHTIRRMLEEHTYWAGVHDRWITEQGFVLTARDYFPEQPAVVRAILPRLLRRSMRRSLHGHGLGRHPPEVVADLAAADLAALSALLGDQPYALGDRPATVDATVTGILWSATSNPFPSVVGDAIRSHPNLVAYLARMRAAYWADFA
jgi:glutathione S-transferase